MNQRMKMSLNKKGVNVAINAEKKPFIRLSQIDSIEDIRSNI
jgi:hypothetical protein